MLVPGTQPRPPLPERPTDTERAAAFTWFIANAGTYEAADSLLTIRPMVAKSPNFMRGTTYTMVFRVRGDSLWLVERSRYARDSTQTVEFTSLLIRREEL